ncbi:MAG: aspartate/glutamate racemase family protein [Ignavibacteria bacterium]
MKTLGLIGGISWHSTSIYYSTINRLVNEKLGGRNSAKLLLYSVNFGEYKALQEKNDWQGIVLMLTEIANKLESAGADCIVICSNTPHLIADKIIEKIRIPLIHIAEETTKVIAGEGVKKIGLLGTKFTMENSFFKDKLEKSGIETVIPAEDERDFIHSVILNELTKGVFKIESKKQCLEIIEKLKSHGIGGVIFGCTEISLLVKPEECSTKVFDTALIHCKAAVEFALSNQV